MDTITYGTPTTLAVKTANDSVMTFELDLTDLPAIYRDGKSSSLDKIKSAINYVSDVRGTLGATQNRLEHTINNRSSSSSPVRLQ